MIAVILSSCAITNTTTTSSTESITSISTADAIKANTPSKIVSTWQSVEIAFFKDRNYIILIDRMIKNDNILYAYSEIKDASIIYFGVYNIKRNKFNKLDYKISNYKANTDLYLIQETANNYYIKNGNSIDVLNSNFKKINTISEISSNNHVMKNDISNDDKYLVKINTVDNKDEINLVDIHSKTSKIIYTFTQTLDNGFIRCVLCAYFINANDILIKTCYSGGGGEKGFIVDIKGNVIVNQVKDGRDISYVTNNKYVYYTIAEGSFSDGDIGLYNLDKNECIPLIPKNQNTYYGLLDIKSSLILYVDDNIVPNDNINSNDVSLKMINIDSKTESTILANFTNMDNFACPIGQIALSQDGKYVYYSFDYYVGNNPDYEPGISFLYIKKIM